ncbi:MAG: (2Fe-2S)-binding protein [Xanthomonadales bacterium]|nr:(2Fe-2S)-binding protein [Xanthomonadales bacterium]
MYVCICNAVTDSDIRKAVDNGVRNMKQLGQATGCGATCGCCREIAIEILQQTLADNRENQITLPVMQMA